MNSAAIYEKVTESILARLAKGVVPWHKPWDTAVGRPVNLATGRPYHGINVWILGDDTFACPYWLTYKQAQSLGGQVRRGEKGRTVVFWQMRTLAAGAGDDADDTGATGRTVPLLRSYTVFNALQCDGLDVPAARPFQPITAAEEIAAGMPSAPTVTHGGEVSPSRL